MADTPAAPDTTGEFIRRWEASGAAERANYALFLSELCDLLDVPRPEPTRPDDAENAYVLERAVTFHNGDGSTSVGRIDLYKRGCFVLEAKQGSERPEPAGALALPRRPRRKGTAVRGTAGWDDAMLAAKGQAEQYVKALPASEPNPPFLVVVDVGHSIELYADFTRQGRTYIAFPDALTHRIKLADLATDAVRERLRLVWTAPLDLDPSRRAARVTRDVAARLAKLAQLLEKSEHTPEAVAQFLMRCLFTFFAEDAGLLPKEGFTAMLKSLRERREHALFPDMARSLWETMKTGGFSPILRASLLRFNGGLFESADALALDPIQLDLLIDAGDKEWRDVEPAIFGTLLERALDPVERHKLGAHYTPRAYVERLVMPTIVEPLRDEWANVQAAAVTLANEGKLPEARDEVRGFLKRLCETTVLDPACGTGNFLYVTLEHMKRLEGEVLDALKGFGETQAAFEGFGLTVDPHQLRGIEINPRAAAIADLVLWIGYLQWHFRTFANRMPAEPVIHAYHNIECRDAVLEYDRTEPVLDGNGQPVTRWDGRTTKKHPVSGRDVPDETARVPLYRYVNPRPARWPESDYVVGNPPYIGTRRMRLALGDGYVDALAEAMPSVPENADYVMYWWDYAAELIRAGRLKRSGLITTNSITQSFNRATLRRHIGAKDRISILFAIPDHPWVDSADGAAVRVAMTVAGAGERPGIRAVIRSESYSNDDEADVTFSPTAGLISEDLRVGASPAEARALRANANIAYWGVKFYGDGFIVTPTEVAGLVTQAVSRARIRPFVSGRDLTARARGLRVIDCDGLSEHDLAATYPQIYQRLLERVKPVREHNPRAFKRERWWIFGENQPGMREAVRGIDRYIATTETAKHRVFQFLPREMLAEGTVAVIAVADAFFMGVLSSRVHVTWALAAGGTLEDRPRYNSTRCFEPFPFPDCAELLRTRVREIAETLDQHRESRQAQHPALTMTEIYNVLSKIRVSEPLTDGDKRIHEDALVSVLKQLHDDLDAAVFDAYGWPHDLTDDEILSRLVDLNRERATEEARGVVRWLRPEFQNPEGSKAATQGALPIDTSTEPAPEAPATPTKKQPWPKALAEQAQAVRAALSAQPGGLTAEQLAKTFQRGQVKRVAELLDTLVSLGQARELADGRYVAA